MSTIGFLSLMSVTYTFTSRMTPVVSFLSLMSVSYLFTSKMKDCP